MPMLNWAGKAKVVNHHNDVPFRVLERKWSFGADGAADDVNMVIHGDNLAALKSLLPRYEGKIKCIYIDPPYNTGNEGDPSIAVIGVDAVDEALEAIRAGTMTATVKQDGDAMGEANIRFAMNYLLNGDWMTGLESKYKLNDDGVSVFIPYAKITAENVDK